MMFTRLFVSALLLLSLHRAMAQDVESEIAEVSKTLVQLRADITYASGRELELTKRLRAPAKSADSTEAEGMRRDLDETRQMLRILKQAERSHQQALRKLEATPTHQFAKAARSDRRKPGKDDLSGVWVSPPNLVGQTWQLEQRGKTISGWGNASGCVGVFAEFRIQGRYQSGLWHLTFSAAHSMPGKESFAVVRTGGKLRLEPQNGTSLKPMTPAHP